MLLVPLMFCLEMFQCITIVVYLGISSALESQHRLKRANLNPISNENAKKQKKEAYQTDLKNAHELSNTLIKKLFDFYFTDCSFDSIQIKMSEVNYIDKHDPILANYLELVRARNSEVDPTESQNQSYKFCVYKRYKKKEKDGYLEVAHSDDCEIIKNTIYCIIQSAYDILEKYNGLDQKYSRLTHEQYSKLITAEQSICDQIHQKMLKISLNNFNKSYYPESDHHACLTQTESDCFTTRLDESLLITDTQSCKNHTHTLPPPSDFPKLDKILGGIKSMEHQRAMLIKYHLFILWNIYKIDRRYGTYLTVYHLLKSFPHSEIISYDKFLESYKDDERFKTPIEPFIEAKLPLFFLTIGISGIGAFYQVDLLLGFILDMFLVDPSSVENFKSISYTEILNNIKPKEVFSDQLLQLFRKRFLDRKKYTYTPLHDDILADFDFTKAFEEIRKNKILSETKAAVQSRISAFLRANPKFLSFFIIQNICPGHFKLKKFNDDGLKRLYENDNNFKKITESFVKFGSFFCHLVLKYENVFISYLNEKTSKDSPNAQDKIQKDATSNPNPKIRKNATQKQSAIDFLIRLLVKESSNVTSDQTKNFSTSVMPNDSDRFKFNPRSINKNDSLNSKKDAILTRRESEIFDIYREILFLEKIYRSFVSQVVKDQDRQNDKGSTRIDYPSPKTFLRYSVWFSKIQRLQYIENDCKNDKIEMPSDIKNHELYSFEELRFNKSSSATITVLYFQMDGKREILAIDPIGFKIPMIEHDYEKEEQFKASFVALDQNSGPNEEKSSNPTVNQNQQKDIIGRDYDFFWFQRPAKQLVDWITYMEKTGNKNWLPALQSNFIIYSFYSNNSGKRTFRLTNRSLVPSKSTLKDQKQTHNLKKPYSSRKKDTPAQTDKKSSKLSDLKNLVSEYTQYFLSKMKTYGPFTLETKSELSLYDILSNIDHYFHPLIESFFLSESPETRFVRFKVILCLINKYILCMDKTHFTMLTLEKFNGLKNNKIKSLFFCRRQLSPNQAIKTSKKNTKHIKKKTCSALDCKSLKKFFETHKIKFPLKNLLGCMCQKSTFPGKIFPESIFIHYFLMKFKQKKDYRTLNYLMLFLVSNDIVRLHGVQKEKLVGILTDFIRSEFLVEAQPSPPANQNK